MGWIYTIKAEYFLWICPWIFLLITKHSIPFSIVLNVFRKWKAQPIPTYIFVFLSPLSRHSILISIVLNVFRKWKAQPIPPYIFVFLSPLSRFESHFVLRDLQNQIKSKNDPLNLRNTEKNILTVWHGNLENVKI